MKIAYYLYHFPKISQSFILNEIYELENRGHEVCIFAINNPEDEINHEEYNQLDAEVYYAGYPSFTGVLEKIRPGIASYSVLKTLKSNSGIKYRATQVFHALEMVDFLKENNFEPDIIHTHFPGRAKLAAKTCSELIDVPLTVETHAHEIFREENLRFSKPVLQSSDGVITVSEFNKNYLENDLGIEKPIDVVPVSVRPEKFEPQGLEEKNKIVSVGRLVEKKGFKYGIKAFAKLKEEHPELRYNIIGKGELEQELKQLAEELGVSTDVNFLGHVSDEDLKREMEEAKAFLLPCVEAENGDLDAMPMVIKEAMALGTACVSTTVSAIPELIEDGKDGSLAEPKDSEELSEKLSELLQSKQTREKMGTNARRKIIEDYDISKNIQKIEERFRKTIS